MLIGIHQPNFLPWPGYFHKIMKSDIFVLLDNVQYTKNSYINRNRIKTSRGSTWLTIPVMTGKRFGQLINEVEIVNTTDWRKKHLGMLEANYKKAVFFSDIFAELKSIYYERDWNNLCDINVRLLWWVLQKLSIEKEMILASSLGVSGKSTELLINIAKILKADSYLSGHGGMKYQDENMFQEAGIKLFYNDFAHFTYPQTGEDTVSGLSVIDLLFNCGPKSKDILLNG